MTAVDSVSPEPEPSFEFPVQRRGWLEHAAAPNPYRRCKTPRSRGQRLLRGPPPGPAGKAPLRSGDSSLRSSHISDVAEKIFDQATLVSGRKMALHKLLRGRLRSAR